MVTIQPEASGRKTKLNTKYRNSDSNKNNGTRQTDTRKRCAGDMRGEGRALYSTMVRAYPCLCIVCCAITRLHSKKKKSESSWNVSKTVWSRFWILERRIRGERSREIRFCIASISFVPMPYSISHFTFAWNRSIRPSCCRCRRRRFSFIYFFLVVLLQTNAHASFSACLISQNHDRFHDIVPDSSLLSSRFFVFLSFYAFRSFGVYERWSDSRFFSPVANKVHKKIGQSICEVYGVHEIIKSERETVARDHVTNDKINKTRFVWQRLENLYRHKLNEPHAHAQITKHMLLIGQERNGIDEIRGKK